MIDPLVDAFKMTIENSNNNDEALLNLSKAIIESVNSLEQRVYLLENIVAELKDKLHDLTVLATDSYTKEIH